MEIWQLKYQINWIMKTSIKTKLRARQGIGHFMKALGWSRNPSFKAQVSLSNRQSATLLVSWLQNSNKNITWGLAQTAKILIIQNHTYCQVARNQEIGTSIRTIKINSQSWAWVPQQTATMSITAWLSAATHRIMLAFSSRPNSSPPIKIRLNNKVQQTIKKLLI